jgi:uncharacterized protein (TIGR03083 family)
MLSVDFTDLRRRLNDEYALMLAAARVADPAAPVPTCPGWTADDLAHHVAQVYLHKAEAIRLRAWPQPWPPERGPESAAVTLATSWAALTAQLDARDPSDPAKTWYEPDQTVGFWIRRMAQETVIHRIDAQLAAEQPVTPIPADLADDCVDEVLTVFLDHGSKAWTDDFAGAFDVVDSRMVEIASPARSWLVVATGSGVDVTDSAQGTPAARVEGDAESLARWLWNRGGAGGVTVSGDESLVDQLRRLLSRATQ